MESKRSRVGSGLIITRGSRVLSAPGSFLPLFCRCLYRLDPIAGICHSQKMAAYDNWRPSFSYHILQEKQKSTTLLNTQQKNSSNKFFPLIGLT